MKPKKATANVEKRLSSMIICHLLVLVIDAARWFLIDFNGISLLQAALSAAPTVLSLIGHASFIRYAIEFLSQKGSIPRKINYSLTALFWLAILSWGNLILLNGFQSAANLQTNYQHMSFSWGYWVGHLSWATACAIGIWLIIRCREGLTGAELSSLLSYVVFPLVALVFRFFWDGAQIFLSTSLALMWISVVAYHDQQQRFTEKQRQLAQSRIAIMLSHIKPEFSDKILANIRDLCNENPQKAKNLTNNFADFLRYNLEAVNQSESIYFNQELLHTKRYIDLEKISRGDKLSVSYIIEADGFCIPSLTVQPLVENAVMQGLEMCEGNCIISIVAKELPKTHIVEIRLHGQFHDSNAQLMLNKLSVSTANVQERLRLMCKGMLTLTSEAQCEMVTTIIIPKQAKAKCRLGNSKALQSKTTACYR